MLDSPASSHNKAGTVSFADGHVALKHWVDPRTPGPPYPPTAGATLNMSEPLNPDIEWLRSVARLC
jgi:prepilin-type processing-associated H-X9-DG protein